MGSVFGAEYVWTGTASPNWVETEFWKAEDKVVIDNNQTYTISSNCSVGELVLNVGSKLIISEGVTVNIGYLSIYGELINNGTIGKIEGKNNHIVIASNASLINAGTISQNSLEMNSGSTMQNLTNSAITFGAVNIQSGAVLDNSGDMIIEGGSTNTGTIKNSGFLDLKGPLVNNSNGILENNGEIESLSGITNQAGGSITNNSSGTISGNINNTGSLENSGGITGAITNNAGGTVTDSGTISGDVSGEGTFEDNPIVVKTYSTISSDTVLDWDVDSSWENGEIPDISGNTAVEITLNADVSIEDFQAFFSEGNEKITLNGTGNLLYDGKKIYISQKSDTELNWNTAENWINGIVPIITGEGNQEVVIVLNSDFISSETLVFNNATGAAIHIYLCGKIISADSVQLVSDWTHPQNNPAGNIHFYGSGTVEIKSLDASNNTNRTSTHRISLYDETIFKITEHAYADPARGEIFDTTGNCEVYIPASGFDMRVPSGKNDGATFVVVGTKAKAIEPQSYYKIEVTTDISATEKIFTFSRSEAGKHNYDLNIPYVVYLMGDASWKLGDTELTDGFEGNVTIPKDNIENGTSQIEKSISLSSGTVESGDGIKVVFYTPCKNLVLKEFIYEKEIIYWTGNVSEDFLTLSNWSLSGTPLGSLDELTGKTVKIPSNCTNYPKLSSDISLEKLVVEDGAEVTILDNVKLTVEKIHIYDSGALKAESGTVVFSGENPSYFAKYPEFSKFGTIEVQSGTFNLNYPLTLTQLNIASGAKFSTTNELVISSIKNSGGFSTTADLYIEKSLTNNGTFQAGKVYLEPSENEITITGQSGDSSEIANKTKISELYCINQAGKNLVINNAISVGKIALSGSSDNRLSIRGNGIIYLETECGDDENDIAQYLDLDESSLPKIENQYITVSDGQFSSENNDIFVENHWINGDAIEYKWVGGASGKENNWNERTNWNIRKVPGEDKNVIISACQNPPILAGQSVTVKTIENNGTIDFAGSTVKTDSITNNGTVKLTGKETFKKQDDTKTSLNNGEASTVIYYGSNENSKFVWGGNYEKLVIEDGFSGSFTPSGIFQSSTSFSVANSIEVENSKVFTKKDDTKDYVLALGGAVKIENKIDSLTIDSEGDQNYNFDIEFEESVVLKSNGSINFPANSEKKFKNGLKLETTKDFSNTGKLISENGDITITSAKFENAQSSELSANSENTFTGKLVVTTATDFENKGTIKAVGVEVNATGIFTNEGTIASLSGDVSIKSASFTNDAEKEISAKNMSIDSGTVTNAGILTATGDFLVNATGDFTSQGKVEVGSELNIKSQNCTVENEVSAGTILLEVSTFESTGNLSSTGDLFITATSITNTGKIKAQNGELETTEANILFGGNSENTFTGKLDVTTATDFENKGTIEVTSGNFSVNVKNNFANNSQITVTTGKLLVNPVINFTNAGNIIAVGVEIDATGIFTNEGKIDSSNADIRIKSARFTNGAEKEIFAKNMSIDSGAVTNAGILTATGDLFITTTSITNSGKIEAQNGELETTEANILFGGNSKNIFTGKLVVKTATDFENKGTIIASEFEINATTDFENKGTITAKKISINSPTVNLAGTINAETNISISGDLYIIGESSISFGEIFLVGTDENSKDMVITALESDIVKQVSLTGGKINVSGNFALFNGNLKLYADLSIEKDMILLNGKTSGENSIYKDNITEIEGLFAYHLNGRPVSCNLETFPTENPINNAQISHEEYKSTLTLAGNLTISVGKNFYSNGVDLGTNTTGSWYLKFPANDAATSSFAECYNATIKNCVVSENTSLGEAWLATENCNDGTGNTNVAFSKAIFANVATISDNIIRVSFVDGNSPLDEKPEIKIENSCNEISAWLENFRFNISSELPEGIKFSGIFANPECTESTDGKGDLSTFYLKYEIPTDGSIDYRWNTDATGSDPGAEESTDTSGVHKNVVPNLGLVRALTASYAGLRDEHKNRLVSVGTGTAGSEPLFDKTKDEAPPVLIAVTLGQEQHETEATAQYHYDSHNFIEWQFSEPVEITYNSVSQGGFGTSTGTELVSNAENIQTTENFGKITNANNGFSVAGLGSFQNGKVTVGSKTGSGEVNAFYRNFALEAGKTATAQEFRIRLSIAGYVDEGNPVIVNGVDYKNWLGFIDSKNTTIPSGTFTMEDSAFLSIKDKSENKNPLVQTKNQPVTVNAMLSAMNEDSKRKTLYGTWDIDPPVVANYMKEDSSNIYAQELIAVNNTSGEIAESLELHFLDNSVYNKYEGKENLQWRTKIGWIKNNVHLPQNIPLDIRGGSRMVSTENQTYGGVRFSTLVDVLDSFVCKNLTTGENIVLNELSQSTTNEVLFGESDENQFDVPYLTLKFENAKGSLLKHNFELEYNKNSQKTAFITDLAGNLLYEFSVKSPDKNPPQFLLSIGGVNHDKLYILFSKPIDYLNQNQEPDEGKLRRIVKSLSIFESSSDGKKDTELISYKLGSQAKVVTETKESTGIEISLTRSVSYDELKNLYIGVNSFDSGIDDEDGDSSQRDPITGETGKYSMLYDMFENPISEDSKHCFSDFAVNAFDVLYAYDGRAIEDAALNQGVFGGNQWTVTDFSGEINNSSKVIAGKDITIAGKIVDYSENPDNQDKFSMLADISPSKNKPDLDFTDYSGINTRLWFSDFVKYFPVNNSITSNNYTTDNLLDNGKIETSISGKDNQSFTYVIPNDKEDSKSVNWVDGDEFEFLFKVLDSNNKVIMVDGNVDGDTDDEVDHPLFALRLKDENDITSIDLWSLHVVELLRQKGGATILNNVINSLNNEETAIEIQVPQTGFLTVQVLTLDGNVVKVLQKGRVEEGTYYYKWNGTNNSGAAVARGMYFIRVVGPKIDETRKVMVIKE